jgi:hypothetical protein
MFVIKRCQLIEHLYRFITSLHDYTRMCTRELFRYTIHATARPTTAIGIPALIAIRSDPLLTRASSS